MNQSPKILTILIFYFLFFLLIFFIIELKASVNQEEHTK